MDTGRRTIRATWEKWVKFDDVTAQATEEVVGNKSVKISYSQILKILLRLA